MAAWASSRRPAPRSISATRASPSSTRAPTASRRTTSSGASSCATTARRRASSWPTCAPRGGARSGRRRSRARCARRSPPASTRSNRRPARSSQRMRPMRRARSRGRCPISGSWASSAAAGSWRRAPWPRRGASRSGEGDAKFLRAKIATAVFFAEHFLPQAPALLPAIRGGATVTGFDLELL